MNFIKTHYEHIKLDENEIPVIENTNTKVIELIVEKIAYGWSAEELAFQHSHLTLGEIYSALAYYYDHQAELDEEIETRLLKVEIIRSSNLNLETKVEKKLKTKGLI